MRGDIFSFEHLKTYQRFVSGERALSGGETGEKHKPVFENVASFI